MSHDRAPLSVEQAISQLSQQVASLQSQITAHRTVFSLLKGYLVHSQTINKDHFNTVVRRMSQGVDNLSLEPEAKLYVRAELDGLLTDVPSVERTFTLIKGGKDD